MTEITLIRKEGKVIFFEAKGHTEYSEQGSDIVCAALSTILQYPIIALERVIKAKNFNYEINEDGFLELNLRELDYNPEIHLLMEAMVEMLKELTTGYPNYLKLIEKEEE